MKIVEILLLFSSRSGVNIVTKDISQASTSSSGNSDAVEYPPIDQQLKQNTKGCQQPGYTQQGVMPQNGQPGGPQKGGKGQDQAQMDPNQKLMEQDRVQ